MDWNPNKFFDKRREGKWNCSCFCNFDFLQDHRYKNSTFHKKVLYRSWWVSLINFMLRYLESKLYFGFRINFLTPLVLCFSLTMDVANKLLVCINLRIKFSISLRFLTLFDCRFHNGFGRMRKKQKVVKKVGEYAKVLIWYKIWCF